MLEKISTIFGIACKAFFIALVIFVILESLSVIDVFEDKEFSCKYSIVEEIVSAEYRDVTVRLANGEIKVINQPRPAIKVGSNVAIDCQYVPVNKAIK